MPGRIAEEAVLATYRCTGFREEQVPFTQRLLVVGRSDDLPRLRDRIEAVALAGDIVDTPPANKQPLLLAERLAVAAAEAGAECTVLRRDDLERLGCRGHLAVAAGSAAEPCLIRLHAHGTGVARLAVVGKGLTCDAGGVNIKLAMLEHMKLDVGGAAAPAAPCCMRRSIRGRRP